MGEVKKTKIIKERFGRYLLLDHVVDGGMAKICRARTLGDKADKIVAIKMIQPQYSDDAAFKTMFLDEIKVTFGLNHPNIAQTYDYGIYGGQLYTAMEYVDGKNLKQYLEKLQEKRFVFPVEISVYIVSQVCQGLHYAHRHVDKLTGRAAKIIHRDVSPHNIMLTYDGAVKLIDFGIAKSVTNVDETQTGTIKGKLSYIAPEYLDGKELDGRYDEFSLGVTIWEMLCSRKLFAASNDLAVLKLIQKCKIPPPSSINPNVPKELDEIILKALSKSPDNRYEDCDKFNRALVKFLYSTYPDFNPTDLAQFARELFKEDIKVDRDRILQFGQIDLKPFLKELERDQQTPDNISFSPSSFEVSGPTAISPLGDKKEILQGESESASGKPAGNDKKDKLTEAEKRRGPEFDFSDSQLGQDPEKKLAAIRRNKKEAKVETSSDPTPLSVSSGNRKIALEKKLRKEIFPGKMSSKADGKEGGRGIKIEEMEKKASFGKLVLMGIIVVLAILLFVDIPMINDSGIKRKVLGDAKNNATPAPQIGKINITNYSSFKHKVFINDVLSEVSLVGEVEVELNKEVFLRVEESEREHFVTTVMLDSSAQQKNVEIPEMAPSSYGYLITSRACVNGQLFFELFGEKRLVKLPIASKEGIAFPINRDSFGNVVPRTHNIKYRLAGDTIDRDISFTI